MSTLAANKTALALLTILLLAGLLRFCALDVTPPGITTDEAANGADVLDILSGKHAVFLERSNGREALFIYLQALSVAVLGPTPVALRLPAAIAGLLTVPAIFLLTRRLAGKTAARLAAGALAVGYWPVQLSREGFRAISLPLLETLAFLFLWRAIRRPRRADFLLAGALLGLSQYTYTSSRLLPIFLLAFALALLVVDRPLLKTVWSGMLLSLAAMVVVAAPLVAYFVAQPASLTSRLVSASASGSLDPPALAAALKANLLPTLAMFAFHGDVQWKYNLASQPVFDPVWAVLFAAGLGLTIVQVRRAEFAFLLLWLAVMLLPGALSGESPHFLRTIGAMPVAYILPAIALAAAGERLRCRVSGRVLVAAVAIFFAGSGALTAWRYFGVWANDSQVSYYFYADMTAASRLLNSWQGPERVVLSAEYYDLHHTMMSYLTSPRPRDVKWIDARRALVYPARAPGGALYVLPASAAPPGGTVERLLPGARMVSEIAGSSGTPLLQAYAVSLATMPEPSRRLNVNLGGMAQILGYGLEPGILTPGQSVTLRIYWRVLRTSPLPASQSYTFFAHLVDGGGYLWAQDDGAGFLTPEWEVGDGVVTTAILMVPADAPPRAYRIRLGMYSPAEPQPLSVLDERGAPAGTEIETEPFTLDRRGASGTPNPPLQPPLNPQWGSLKLNGYALSRETLGPGETLRVTLHWTAVATPEADHQVSVELTDAAGAVRAAWLGPLVTGYPTTSWPAGESIRNWYDLVVPADTPAGAYRLAVRLDPAGGPSADLGTVRVAGRPRSFTSPDIQHPLRAQVSDFGQLLGYALDANPARAGQPLKLTLYWRALATPPVAYKVFVHLLDTKSAIWGQRDAEPRNGEAPTTSWIPGEIISDTYSIPVQPGAPPGEYDIEIGMYSQSSGARLPMTSDAGHLIGDHIIVGRVAIVQ